MLELDIRQAADVDGCLDLLLLADPSETLVRDYVADGLLYQARWDDVLVGVFVLLKHDDALMELKNIAVADEWQGKGVGRALLTEARSVARRLGAKRLEVGTGNSSLRQLGFYQRAGFRMVRIAKDYFTLNYDEAIIEDGIPCRDMVMLSLDLTEEA